MKKWLLVLGMITCILGISACGKVEEAATESGPITEADALTIGDQLIEYVALVCEQNQQEESSTDAVIAAAFESWTSAQEDMGNYVKILDRTAKIDDNGIVINATVEGTVRNAKVEIIIDEEYALSSITTSVVYSFSELMYKAFLNTLLGMGTVFVILILISGIIYCFNFIPKIQAAFSKPKVESMKPAEVDNTITQVVEHVETTDDLEVIAVIAAAIAASEGKASTDGFVVRSIRKRRAY